MFPLHSSVPISSFPVVTWLIILVNVLVFLGELALGDNFLSTVFKTYGLVPAHFVQHFNYFEASTLFTSMFLHGGLAHLLGNMWFLHVFGDGVEDRMGHGRFLGFYLLAGVCAGITQTVLSPASTAPMIGASGAISGVLGAYLIMFARYPIVTLIPFGFFARIIDVPAPVFLGFWFILQLFTGLFALSGAAAGAGEVAFWAHVGGFLAGMCAAGVFGRKTPPQLPHAHI